MLFGLPVMGISQVKCPDCGEMYTASPWGCHCYRKRRRNHREKLEKVHPYDQSYRYYGLGKPPIGHINKPLEECWAYSEKWEKEAELKLLNVRPATENGEKK